MTQSNDNNDYVFTLDGGETIDLSGIIDTTDDYTLDISSISSASMANNVYTITGSSDTITIGNTDINTDWVFDTGFNNINPSEVERMCKEYPALEKVWRNFKSVYDMVKQDYDGKVKAGELDDDIPF